jgi:23S rRNA (cytosine1962-C5)-methyltransferase
VARLSRDRVALDEAYLDGAIQRAVARRAPGDFRRLVWSESDDLPGVVADQYGDVIVLQIQTLAMEKALGAHWRPDPQAPGPAEVIFRNDAPIRRLEGLAMEVHTRSGKPWEPRWASIDGFDVWLDLMGGQKTGFYLDQRVQHQVVAKYCAGKRVLDAFCNQGSFGIHASRAGASQVMAIDSAADAIDGRQAKRRAQQGRRGFPCRERL